MAALKKRLDYLVKLTDARLEWPDEDLRAIALLKLGPTPPGYAVYQVAGFFFVAPATKAIEMHVYALNCRGGDRPVVRKALVWAIYAEIQDDLLHDDPEVARTALEAIRRLKLWASTGHANAISARFMCEM